MVRLRSNRWYSADGQRRSRTIVASSASGTRRLLSLCFLLGLVIILMQKAADPQHVRRAFNALGVPLDEPGQILPDSAADDQQPGSIVNAVTEDRGEDLSDEQRWTKACRDLIDRLMADASGDLINELSLSWFAVKPSTNGWASEPARDSWYAGTLSQLEALAGELDEQVASATPAQQSGLVEWRGRLERFREIWEAWFHSVLTDGASVMTEASSSAVADPGSMEWRVFRQQLTTVLDQRLMANLRDAATWSKRESVPFWRLLQRAGAVASQEDASSREGSDPPLFNTLQLQAEAAQRKGMLVRFRGSVRRIEWVPHTHALLPDSEGYWLLWMRGADLSDQPVAVYTTHRLPQQLQRSLSNEVYPDIEVLGLIGKKLAYSATSGVEVAPTLFAASLYQRINQRAAPEMADANSTASLGRELQIAVLGGLFAAGLILFPILSAWSRKGKGTERRPRSRVVGRMGLLVLVGGWSSPALALQEPQEAVDVPPWARTDPAQEMADVLRSQFTTAFDQRAVAELQDYLGGAADRFPDNALKLAYTLRKLQRPGVSLPQLSVELEALGARLETVVLSGSARLAMPVALDEQQQLWFQADDRPQLYRLEIETLSSQRQAGVQSIPPPLEWSMVTVYCEQVPSSWMTTVQLRQPAMVRGLAIRRSNDSESGELLCVFAKSVQWKIAQGDGVGLADVQPPLSVHSQQLLEAGWDLAHLDVVRPRQQQPLEAEDIQPFYSLLAVAERMGQPQAEQRGEPLFEVLKEPGKFAAAPIAWPVRVVRGTEVQVEPHAAELLGSSSYFQFDGFVDIGRKTIQYRTGSEPDAEVVSFQGEFPITLVARSCPASFARPPDIKATSWDIGQPATASGLFFRLWSYESERMNAVQSNARQAAPLVVLQNLQPRVVQVVRTDDPGWFGYALMVVMVAISGGIIWLAASKK